MEVVGALSAVLATIDLCLKYGSMLAETCNAFHNAETQIRERSLHIRSLWLRTARQLEFLKKICGTLDAEFRTIQNELLCVLITKLQTADLKLQDVQKASVGSNRSLVLQPMRLKFVSRKNYLDRVIDDLASWQDRYNPSWYLIMRIADPLIDQALSERSTKQDGVDGSTPIEALAFRDAAREEPLQSRSIFLPANGLKDVALSDIPFSTAKFALRVGRSTHFVIDNITCEVESAAGVDIVMKDIRTLAKKLSCGDASTFGFLQCRGVVRIANGGEKESISFDFVFNAPAEYDEAPVTLRSILASRASHTLTERFSLARHLAKSISYLHTLGFVHKNVRPETILGYVDQHSRLGPFFLIGFDMIRMVDGRSLQRGDSAWEKNLYRHPDRQGLRPQELYNMQHDIYSLGVCLLEIGLWESLVSRSNPAIGPIPGEILNLSSETIQSEPPSIIKERLVAIAKSKLPERMGEIYKDVVINCLTCLDEDNADFGDPLEFQDADGITIGVRYIEKVLLELQNISV